jgi:ribonuclease P protein component
MRTASIDARVAASLFAFPRVGIVVPRYRHSAVDRNRLKRRLRELARLELLPVLPPGDYLLRTLPLAYDRSFEQLQREIGQLLGKMTR